MKPICFATLSSMLLIIAGCGPSAEQEKADKAVSHALARKSPGFVRVINLSGSAVTIHDGGRVIAAAIESQSASRLQPLGTGEKMLGIEGSVKKAEFKVGLDSNMGTTGVYGPGQNDFFFVHGEPRYPENGKNCLIFVRNMDGSPASAPAGLTLDGPLKKQITSDSQSENLNSGDYKVMAGSTTLAEIKVDSKFAYSIFVFMQNGKAAKGFALVNSQTEKPVLSGASAS
jgi:hypothetical protein